MIPRGMAGVALIATLLLLGWTYREYRTERRRADRADARADSLATEIAASQLRELGWETTLAGVTRDLTRLLEDSVATVLEAARSRPIVRTVFEATAGGSSAAELDSVASGPDSTVYLVEDGPLSGVITTWADSALARLEWQVEISAELVHSVAADGRLVSIVRSPDPRIRIEVPELAWSPPPPPPGPSRLRWLVAGLAIGVVGWELVR